jgi:hypothetical protein
MEWRENIYQNINPNNNIEEFQNNENYIIEILESKKK